MVQSSHCEELRVAYPEAQIASDAGMDYVRIPSLSVATGGEQRNLTGLLCPSQHGDYQTRLFLSEPIQGRGNNWTTAYINGSTWHVWSWNGVPSHLTLLQILSAHLRAFQ